MMNFLENLIDESMFDILRNKQQLGYTVYCGERCTRGVSGLLFTIESSKYNPWELQEKILTFIQTFYDSILTEKLYTDFLKGLINKKSESFKDITEDYFLQNQKKDLIWHRRDE